MKQLDLEEGGITAQVLEDRLKLLESVDTEPDKVAFYEPVLRRMA